MITDREKFLMIQWAKAEQYYENIDQWISEVIDDVGHTVEQALSYDADQHAEQIKDTYVEWGG